MEQVHTEKEWFNLQWTWISNLYIVWIDNWWWNNRCINYTTSDCWWINISNFTLSVLLISWYQQPTHLNREINIFGRRCVYFSLFIQPEFLSLIQKLDQMQSSFIQSEVTMTYHVHVYCIITFHIIVLPKLVKTLSSSLSTWCPCY